MSMYGEVLAEGIFDPDKYYLFKNMYMYWNADLEIKLQKYRGFGNDEYTKHDMFVGMEGLFQQKEMMLYINSIVQTLVENIFTQGWDKHTFLKHYGLYMYWVEYGLKYAK